MILVWDHLLLPFLETGMIGEIKLKKWGDLVDTMSAAGRSGKRT